VSWDLPDAVEEVRWFGAIFQSQNCTLAAYTWLHELICSFESLYPKGLIWDPFRLLRFGYLQNPRAFTKRSADLIQDGIGFHKVDKAVFIASKLKLSLEIYLKINCHIDIITVVLDR
jgi:hypothetical protein